VTLLFAAFSVLILGALGSVALARRGLSSAVGAGSAGVGSALGVLYAVLALARGTTEAVTLPWAIPNGSLSIGVDPLSAFFLVPLFGLSGLAAVYGHHYLLEYASRRSLALPWAAFNVLVASMALVVTARHAVLLLVAWEVMSIAAYLLVTFEHEQASVRRAGWVYLIATHLGVAFLVAMFLLLGKHAGSFEFSAMLGATVPKPLFATLLFLFALIGFGAKSGLVPFHVWLPEAHAAAPSHVSAVMSGVLIKMGVYGILRVVLLLGGPRTLWGPLLMCIGVGGGALGIGLALYQRDIKRVLAYSSIENVGLITLGIGIGFWGATTGRPIMATLGLAGGLLHVWNHAVMKGLMFLGAGSILYGCHTKDLEKLGGLLKRMPQTATLLIVGAVAIAGLPPLNGFVSEWLLYSGLLHGALAVEGPGAVAVLVTIAAISMVGAMAVLCFARLVSVVLLGTPRSAGTQRAHESSLRMTAPMGVLALAAIALSLAPSVVLGPLKRVLVQLLGAHAGDSSLPAVGLTKAGLLNAGVATIVALAIALAALAQRRRAVALEPTWGCGYVAPTVRMQYTARAVSELFTSSLLPRVFGPRLSVRAPEGLFPAPSRVEADTVDPLTRGAYEPFFSRWADRFARLRFLQQGLLHIYVVYILLTLLLALGWSAATGFTASP
jgi:formate hydrogenlyase subunit 3/multisubunit Na+/H+ antiporter MnhD subunit